MARARRRRGSAMSKKAGAFAPSMSGGRSIGWESLSVDYAYDDLPTMFPSVAAVVGGRTRRFVSLLPANVTRGVVTLERLRMQCSWWGEIGNYDGATQGDNLAHPCNIQLVPIQDGAIALDSVLSPRNAADQESNRIIWRHVFWPDFSGDPIGTAVEALRVFQHRAPLEFDVKSKRRFDRAVWALIFVVEYSTLNEVMFRGNLDIRALFRSSDGV